MNLDKIEGPFRSIETLAASWRELVFDADPRGTLQILRKSSNAGGMDLYLCQCTVQ